MNWQELVAIDIHTHAEVSCWNPHDSYGEEYERAADKYIPPQLVQYANTLLRECIQFGSDHPLIRPDRWLQDFAAAGFRDEVRPLILKQNAVRLLRLAGVPAS